jgi:hypothetical protein
MSHGFNVLMENLVLRFCEQKAVILTGIKQDIFSNFLSP